jgi:tetratricopeptide (TPR) repeat protein
MDFCGLFARDISAKTVENDSKTIKKRIDIVAFLSVFLCSCNDYVNVYYLRTLLPEVCYCQDGFPDNLRQWTGTLMKNPLQQHACSSNATSGRWKRLLLIALVSLPLLASPLLPAIEDEFARRLQAGVEETSKGDLSAAMADLEAAVRLNPESAEAWYQFGLLLGQVTDFRGAEAAFRHAVKLKPHFARARYNLALTLVANPGNNLDWPGAINELHEALKSQPNYPEALNLLGTGLMSTGNVDDAISQFELAIQLSPTLAVAHFNLAMALERSGRLDEAIKEYKSAIAARGGYPEASTGLGKLLLHAGRSAEAETELKEALHQNPDLPDAHYALAGALRSLSRSNEAAVELEEFKDLSQRVPDATESSRLSNLALETASKGDMSGAVILLRRAIELKPDYGIPHYNLGLILADQGDMPGAVKELSKAISLLPGQAKPCFDLGRVLRRQGDNQGALAAIAWAARLSPTDPAIHSELVSLRATLHRDDDAVESSTPKQPAVGAFSDTAIDHERFGQQLFAQEDFMGARGELLRSLALKPARQSSRMALASDYDKLRDYNRAVLEYHKLLLSAPSDAEVHLGLGNVLLEQGNAKAAADEFRIALTYRPESAEARAALDKAQKTSAKN